MTISPNISWAKAIPLAQILDTLGHTPTRQNNHEIWYHSPFRQEKTASFHIHIQKNSWYDFGIGKGGDSVDFVCTYLKTSGESHTVADALRWLQNMTGGVNDIRNIETYTPPSDTASPLFIKSSKPVEHPALIEFLNKRCIPLPLAKLYLKEVRIFNNQTQKRFFALGFLNEDNGCDIRNPFFKGCVGTKTISFIRGSRTTPQGIHVFEGFMDYLAALVMHNASRFNDDVIVLNSLACLKHAVPYIKNYGYRVAYTWLDNDKAGREATTILHEFFASQDNLQHKKMNHLYEGHKDVNDGLMAKQTLTIDG